MLGSQLRRLMPPHERSILILHCFHFGLVHLVWRIIRPGTSSRTLKNFGNTSRSRNGMFSADLGCVVRRFVVPIFKVSLGIDSIASIRSSNYCASFIVFRTSLTNSPVPSRSCEDSSSSVEYIKVDHGFELTVFLRHD